MIKLTKMNGNDFYINADLIEKIDTVPNTIITMNSQVQYLVKESILIINELIVEEKQKFFNKL
ncbi:MAG: hypothetical protein A2015_14175 [Spirochaetes bacterium GWF1_31_7]|nr:MAG: hypothetical protein A2Y30_03575 [Spirochaetes bacterium GWE1_32_154]OHD45253.1 MAG: hypothetical protein A2Y29_02370 [Spirochaetes bacterium GWE2_31_10]OHD50548.1 MAG: hypothetical protein A2015_14175 [Spirochaetes bacterium GWF1_31_7]HBD94199.1 flagellar protein FlbD [Spirochaetia bacterium]HBI36574.1 flagellar protein FlbD [Spirochaetia bacterium]